MTCEKIDTWQLWHTSGFVLICGQCEDVAVVNFLKCFFIKQKKVIFGFHVCPSIHLSCTIPYTLAQIFEISTPETFTDIFR
jgi:hypothetical protein